MEGVGGRLYLGLIAGVGIVLSCLGWLGWWGLTRRFPWEQAVAGLLFAGFLTFALLVFASLLAVIYGLYYPASYSSLVFRLASSALHWLYAPAACLGRAFGIDQDKIRASFIDLHNQLASRLSVRVKPEQILVLAPVCLQLSSCPRKVTVDVDNCGRCGRCRISDLLDLRDSYGIRVAVATGGTYARKLLRDLRPRAVVAIACERDLVSGLQDARPLIVLGITNSRPNGPCFNTTVDITKVETAICHFVRGEEGVRRRTRRPTRVEDGGVKS